MLRVSNEINGMQGTKANLLTALVGKVGKGKTEAG